MFVAPANNISQPQTFSALLVELSNADSLTACVGVVIVAPPIRHFKQTGLDVVRGLPGKKKRK
jgi:hypothetical protein